MRIISILCVALSLAVMSVWCSCSSGTAGATVKKTPGGYEYIHHVANEGAKPAVGEYAYFYYQQRVDDSLMDVSREKDFVAKMEIPTAEILKAQPNPVIESLMLMSPGDSLTVILPLDSMPRVPPGWEDKENMYFDLMMTEIKTAEEYNQDAAAEKLVRDAELAKIKELEAGIAEQAQTTLSEYKAGKLKDVIKETSSGLKYVIHDAGTGEQAAKGKRVKVQYYGLLADNGTMFDNSFRRGQAFEFQLGIGQVIAGWDEGIALLKEGAKATLFIPYELGYGDTGSPPTIPPKAELVFYVQLEDVH